MKTTSRKTTSVCKNPFIDSDGFCPLCGKNHLNGRPTKAAARKAFLAKIQAEMAARKAAAA